MSICCGAGLLTSIVLLVHAMGGASTVFVLTVCGEDKKENEKKVLV